MHRNELSRFLTQLLNTDRFQDYCPNGLQVEGREHIQKIAFAVSATRDSINQSVALHADALIVHHGLFWKFHGARPLTGSFAQRIVPLIQHQINLFGYHLPLDAHPDIGNAAVLGRQIGCQQQAPFGDYQGSPTGIEGVLEQPISARDLQTKLAQVLDHPVLLASPDEQQLIETVGIITGGANGDWQRAQQAGLDAYITGEMSEHDWHESQENGIHMFAGGHAATEKGGIINLMHRIEQQWPVECVFIDSRNPA